MVSLATVRNVRSRLVILALALAGSACTGVITTGDGDDPIEGLLPGDSPDAAPGDDTDSDTSPAEPDATPGPTEPDPTPTEPDPPPIEPGPVSDLVPNIAYCAGVADWPDSATAREDEILELVNVERSRGATCGQQVFGPAPPMTMNPALRCAARVHSLDMADNGYFDHINLQGEAPWDRMENAGYSWSNAAENIAGGSSTAQGTMNQWMNSPGHCSNIMNPQLTELGVGEVANLWTQVFGRPR